MDKLGRFKTPPPCDCCHAMAWEYLFTESEIDLGRCAQCGLHYIAQMPKLQERITEMEEGHFADRQLVLDAGAHLEGELMRRRRLQTLVDIARRFTPSGKWLDIGCGTGTFILVAKESGVDTDGIELTADRRTLARKMTGARVYDRPLEELAIAPESFAAVTLINVFSHLASPTETFSHIRRVLSVGGIMVLLTGEIGRGVRKGHVFSWSLGDHLYFLGEGTIERYAENLKFRLVYRDKVWQPATVFTRERFRMRGRSKLRNLAKLACLYTPGVFPLLRWYMLTKRHAGNPIYTSTLVLQKTEH